MPIAKRRTPTQARATRTRAALLEAAAQEFAERGYAGTTARSIALRAGAATGSFYQYFNDKDEVLLEIYAQRLLRVREAAERLLASAPNLNGSTHEQTRGVLSSVIQLVIDLHRDDPKLHAVITEREHADSRMRDHTHRAMNTLIQAISQLLTALGYQGDVLARAFCILHLVEGSVHAHVLGDPLVSDRRFKRDLVEAVEMLAVPASALSAKGAARRALTDESEPELELKSPAAAPRTRPS
jgi:AcrR family transcriptional regulator